MVAQLAEDNFSNQEGDGVGNPLLDNVTPLRAEPLDFDFQDSTKPLALAAYEGNQYKAPYVEQRMSLGNLCGGDAEMTFQIELQKVLENIADLNTDASKAREINLKIVMKPSKNRSTMEMSVAVSSKLAPWKAMSSSVMLDQQAGRHIAAERHVPVKPDVD